MHSVSISWKVLNPCVYSKKWRSLWMLLEESTQSNVIAKMLLAPSILGSRHGVCSRIACVKSTNVIPKVSSGTEWV